MLMAELLVPWKPKASPEGGNGPWQASFQTAGPVLLLTVFMDGDGLWHAVVELKYSFGPDWKSPSPFATAELAMEWAEGQAEKLKDWR